MEPRLSGNSSFWFRSTCVSSDFAFVQAVVEDLDLVRLHSVKFYTFAEIYLIIELRWVFVPVEVCTWIKCISIVFEKPVPCKQFEYSLVLGFDIGLYPRFRRPFSNFWFCLCLTSGKNPNFWLQSSSDSEIQSRFSNSTLKSQITSWPNSIRKRTKKHIQVVSVYGPFPIWFCPDGQSTTAKTYWSSKSSAFEQFIKINMPKNWIFRSLPSLSCLNSFATVQGTNEYADFIGKLMLTKQL